MPVLTFSGDSCCVKTARILIATLATTLTLALGAVVALAAPGAVTKASSPQAGAAKAAYCPAGEKKRRQQEFKRAQAQLKAFQKGQLAARKQYFRTHPKAKDRVAFLKRQKAQEKAMKAIVKRKQREFAQCE